MRKFKCIGLEEREVDCWNEFFTIGGIYILKLEDGSDSILLKDNDGDYLWVDADQFEEVI